MAFLLLLLLLHLTFTVSHKIIVFLPEVNGEPAFVLFLQVGHAGDVEQDLTEVVLVDRTQTPVSDGGGSKPLLSSPHRSLFPQRHQMSVQLGPQHIVPVGKRTGVDLYRPPSPTC